MNSEPETAIEQLVRRADTHCDTVYCEPGLTACKADNRQLADEARMDILRAGAEMLRAYPDYRGVMGLAAALLLGEDHPHRKQPEDASHPDGAGAVDGTMSQRDKFIEVLRSRRMMRPGEEWVVDANLNAFAHQLAERQRENCEKVTCGPYGTQCRCDAQADLIDPQVTP